MRQEAGSRSVPWLDGDGTAAAPAPDQVQPQPVRATTVTLITGDVVRLTTDRTGRQAATVKPGPVSRPGGFASEQRDGHTYVIPRAAQAYVASGLVDERL